jgi:hypothetical protein
LGLTETASKAAIQNPGHGVSEQGQLLAAIYKTPNVGFAILDRDLVYETINDALGGNERPSR